MRKFFFFACLLSLPCYASLKTMTLNEKIGQLLLVHFHGEEANEEAKILIQDLHVGGFIYYNWANGLHSPEQIRKLSLGLQQLNSVNSPPLFITVDQEGGIVTRFTQGFTVFPGNKALGMTGDPKWAELAACAMGEELLSVGVNLNLSPVVDINSNPRNPVIGIRSFGDSAKIVVPFAKSALQGYHQSGILTCLKHFPGHGDVEIDPHQDLPRVEKSLDQLKGMELVPFKELALEADSIMTGHILLPSLDPQNCATLSKKVLDILRLYIGFKGVIIADSLVMEGFLKNCPSIEEGAAKALQAGCDLLLLGGKQLTGKTASLELTVTDIRRIHHFLVEAVKSGKISEERVDQSVQRILDLKNRLKAKTVPLSLHQELAHKIASLALQMTRSKPFPLLAQSSIALFAPAFVEANIAQTTLLQLGKENSSLFFHPVNPTEEEIYAANKLAKKAEVIIFCSYNAWKSSGQEALIHSLLKTGKPLILISLGDPLDATLFPEAHCILKTFSPTPVSIQAAHDLLEIRP